MKVAYAGESLAEKVEEAYNQIFEQHYNKPYPNAICIGMAIEDEKRQIMEYKIDTAMK
jgi:hypothetical protein